LGRSGATGTDVDKRLITNPAIGQGQICVESLSTTVLVIPTNEDLAIARACMAAI
jgi:acetate kinase